MDVLFPGVAAATTSFAERACERATTSFAEREPGLPGPEAEEDVGLSAFSFLHTQLHQEGLAMEPLCGLAAEIRGDEGIMKLKSHGSCDSPPMKVLRWNCSNEIADRICCFNRTKAEPARYWEVTSEFFKALPWSSGQTIEGVVVL